MLYHDLTDPVTSAGKLVGGASDVELETELRRRKVERFQMAESHRQIMEWDFDQLLHAIAQHYHISDGAAAQALEARAEEYQEYLQKAAHDEAVKGRHGPEAQQKAQEEESFQASIYMNGYTRGYQDSRKSALRHFPYKDLLEELDRRIESQLNQIRDQEEEEEEEE